MSNKSKSEPKFKSGLLLELKDQLEDKKFNFILSIFTMKKIALVSVVLVLAVGGILLYSNSRNAANKVSTVVTEQLPAKEDNSPSMGLRLAMDTWTSIEEAQKSTSFSIIYPRITLQGEGIGLIETSKDFEGSDPNKDSYYITYAKGGKELYKVSGLAWAREDTLGEKVTINGSTGYYYQIPESELGESSGISLDGPSQVIRAYVYWNKDGKSYEVAAITNLSKDELVKLAESML